MIVLRRFPAGWNPAIDAALERRFGDCVTCPSLNDALAACATGPSAVVTWVLPVPEEAVALAEILGQTSPVVALVPGKPAHVRETLAALHQAGFLALTYPAFVTNVIAAVESLLLRRAQA